MAFLPELFARRMPLIFWTSPCAYTEGRLGYTVDLLGEVGKTMAFHRGFQPEPAIRQVI